MARGGTVLPPHMKGRAMIGSPSHGPERRGWTPRVKNKTRCPESRAVPIPHVQQFTAVVGARTVPKGENHGWGWVLHGSIYTTEAESRANPGSPRRKVKTHTQKGYTVVYIYLAPTVTISRKA